MPTAAINSRIPGDIVKYRWVWFGVVAVFLLISFNGQWQIGPDSAGFRALGHQLATTGRYFFREQVPGVPDYLNQQSTRDPGLPLLLAGLEKMFGPGALAPLLCMMGIAVATLLVTYRVMLSRLEPWLAVSVVVGMGTNPRFLQYANEILSDMPFLLGLVLTLWGFEKLLRANRPGQITRPLLLIGVGLLLAALMRPTFWILAVALALACVWGLLTGREGVFVPQVIVPRSAGAKDAEPAGGVQAAESRGNSRRRFLWPLVAMLAAAVLFVVVLDVRAKHGMGGYERHAADQLAAFFTKAPGNMQELMQNAVPTAFLGNTVSLRVGTHHVYLGYLISLVVFIAGAALIRRNTLWGLLVLLTFGGLVVYGPVPRYFLMILPLLLAGWGVMTAAIAATRRTRWGANVVMGIGLGVVFCFNIASTCDFVRLQHGLASPIDAHHHWRGLHHQGFLQVYHQGQWAHIKELAAMIHAQTPATQKLIGPESTVLTYLSGRQIYPPTVVQAEGSKPRLFPRAMVNVSKGRIFTEYDDSLNTVMDYGSIVLNEPVSQAVGGYRIFQITVVALPPPPRYPNRDVEDVPPRHRRGPRTLEGDDGPTTEPE